MKDGIYHQIGIMASHSTIILYLPNRKSHIQTNFFDDSLLKMLLLCLDALSICVLSLLLNDD